MEETVKKPTENTKAITLDTAITAALKIPGVKVNRSKFLADAFAALPDKMEAILEDGPVVAGMSREELAKLAKSLILRRTSESSIASFAAGIPGGFAMAATIPADVLQFFGMTLRLAQELSYLYGAPDLWKNGEIVDDKVKRQLVLYTGVMFGVTGAAAGVRVLSSQLAKTTLQKLPQKALTKTLWYPVVKKIGKAIGINITKKSLANGVSKVIPIVGGVISGGLNFASMLPMANRLQSTLDKSCFDYTEAEYEADQEELRTITVTADDAEPEKSSFKENVSRSAKAFGSKVSGLAGKVSTAVKRDRPKSKVNQQEDILNLLAQLKNLETSGVITPDEFEEKKKELLARL